MELPKDYAQPEEEQELPEEDDDKDIDLDNNDSKELPGPEDVDLNRAE